MLASLATLIGPLIPVLAQIIFQVMKAKKVDAENQRKFLEAIQSIDALKSKNLKRDYDKLIKKLDNPEVKEVKSPVV